MSSKSEPTQVFHVTAESILLGAIGGALSAGAGIYRGTGAPSGDQSGGNAMPVQFYVRTDASTADTALYASIDTGTTWAAYNNGAIAVLTDGTVTVTAAGGSISETGLANLDLSGSGTLNLTGAGISTLGSSTSVWRHNAGAVSLTGATTVEIDGSGAVAVESSGGAISVGADAVAQAVNIATGAAARVISIGNAASTSLALEGGVGAVTVNADTTIDLNANVNATNGLDVTTAALTAAAALTVSGGNLSHTGTDIDLDPTGTFALDMDATKTATITLADNLDAALLIQEGANSYIEIDTQDAQARVIVGNVATNPTLQQLGTGQVSFAGNVDAANGLDVTTAALTAAAGLTVSGGAIDLDPTAGVALDMDAGQTIAIDVSDNLDAAFLIEQGTDAYLEIDTRDGVEIINVGNAVTNPDFSVLGSGQITLTGNVNATAGLDVSGAALTVTGFDVAMNSRKLTGLAAGSAAGDSLRYEQAQQQLNGAVAVFEGSFAGNLSDTETITIGADIYEADNNASITGGRISVTIGGSAELTLDALVTAINTQGTSNVLAVKSGTDTLVCKSATAPGGTAVAADPSIVLAETAAQFSWKPGAVNVNTLGGEAAALKKTAVAQLTITTDLVAASPTRLFTFDFTPSRIVSVYITAAGVPRYDVTDAFSISGNDLLWTSGGATHLANTNVVTVMVIE